MGLDVYYLFTIPQCLTWTSGRMTFCWRQNLRRRTITNCFVLLSFAIGGVVRWADNIKKKFQVLFSLFHGQMFLELEKKGGLCRYEQWKRWGFPHAVRSRCRAALSLPASLAAFEQWFRDLKQSVRNNSYLSQCLTLKMTKMVPQLVTKNTQNGL